MGGAAGVGQQLLGLRVGVGSRVELSRELVEQAEQVQARRNLDGVRAFQGAGGIDGFEQP